MDLNKTLFNMRIGQSATESDQNLNIEYIIHMVQHGWIITTVFKDTGTDDEGTRLPPVVTTELLPFPDDMYEE